MVTTLPRVHVALMGIEKLIPTLADLDRLLKLLRAIRHRPEADGLHDAHQRPAPRRRRLRARGRARRADRQRPLARLMASENAEILGCIRCGACMNVCPVYTSIGGHAYGDTYPGPVGAVVTPGLRGLRRVG